MSVNGECLVWPPHAGLEYHTVEYAVSIFERHVTKFASTMQVEDNVTAWRIGPHVSARVSTTIEQPDRLIARVTSLSLSLAVSLSLARSLTHKHTLSLSLFVALSLAFTLSLDFALSLALALSFSLALARSLSRHHHRTA